jgi:hypothetical protein
MGSTPGDCFAGSYEARGIMGAPLLVFWREVGFVLRKLFTQNQIKKNRIKVTKILRLNGLR